MSDRERLAEALSRHGSNEIADVLLGIIDARIAASGGAGDDERKRMWDLYVSAEKQCSQLNAEATALRAKLAEAEREATAAGEVAEQRRATR